MLRARRADRHPPARPARTLGQGAWLLALLCLCLCGAAAQTRQPVHDARPLAFRSAAEEARFHALAAELRCVQCQNQSLADSNAQIAQDLRREVLDLMHEGHDDSRIRQFLVDRYGQFVLYQPPIQPGTWLLWGGPLLFLGAGGVWVGRLVRRRSAAMAACSPEGGPER